MIEEIFESIKALEKRIDNLRGCLDIRNKEKSIEELQKVTLQEGFWNDTENARNILRDKSRLDDVVGQWKRLHNSLRDATILLDMARDEGDESILDEIKKDIDTIEVAVRESELKMMLGSEEDSRNAIMSINSGAGGTEAQDWAQMLLRMYLRWAERREFKTEIIDFQPGDEAGVKSVTITISGEYAYGYSKAEVGIHRLVRISPFDTGRRRHTSFASVFVYPEVNNDVDVDIDEKDLRIDTYRSSGAGGQHVNKTDSAVRITHIPTGIVVQCQNERSQHKNRATALKVLRSRLYEMKLREQREKKEELNKTKKQIAWGSQIRSYVLHPYKLIKDHRTNLEVGNVDRVLDGDIDGFIEAYLIS
ncbi:MAG: peptide chain release factor 2 [Thermodesulfobacteriota bacterium]|nr:peptide chain release factor 2 [Thermodesulfobacteriota bacterium]